MASAILLRAQLEASLADRIPGAFTPKLRLAPETLPTGIQELDALLEGGVPRGSITEIVGGSTTGRTALALSILSRATRKGAACAWVDAVDAFDPESAAARGVVLERLLWLRAGGEGGHDNVQDRLFTPNRIADPLTQAPQAAGWVHPRNETRTLDRAIPQLFRGNAGRSIEKSPGTAARGKLVSLEAKQRRMNETAAEPETWRAGDLPKSPSARKTYAWMRLDQSLRATDLLLQAGGFSVIVMDMSDLHPEQALRIPIASWHRFRLAVEQAQSTLLVLTKTASAKSCATLALRCEQVTGLRRWQKDSETALFVSLKYRTTVERNRNEGIDPFRKKPVSRVSAEWETQVPWVGIR